MSDIISGDELDKGDTISITVEQDGDEVETEMEVVNAGGARPLVQGSNDNKWYYDTVNPVAPPRLVAYGGADGPDIVEASVTEGE